MFAELALRGRWKTVGTTRAARGPSRPLSFFEIEEAVTRIASERLGVPVALLSIARADDASYAVIECGINVLPRASRLEGAAHAVACAIDPAALGVRPGADVRVRFSEPAIAG